MTVRDLIEELQRQPNLDLPVVIRRDGKKDWSGKGSTELRVPVVVYHGPHTAIEDGELAPW